MRESVIDRGDRFTGEPWNHPTGRVVLDRAPSNSIIANNIIYGETTDSTMMEVIASPDNIYSHNLLYAEDGAEVGDMGEHVIREVPQFREGDYRPKPDSPAWGAGMPLGSADDHGLYHIGSRGVRPEVGPSPELVEHVLALPPVDSPARD